MPGYRWKTGSVKREVRSSAFGWASDLANGFTLHVSGFCIMSNLERET